MISGKMVAGMDLPDETHHIEVGWTDDKNRVRIEAYNDRYKCLRTIEEQLTADVGDPDE